MSTQPDPNERWARLLDSLPPGDTLPEDDYTTPEGYDDSPDQGVHHYDGGGTFP